MKIYQIALGTLLIGGLSTMALASRDFTLRNDTSSFITSQLGSSRCSSQANKNGIISPKSTVTIPSILFDTFCRHRCEVTLYLSKSCEASKRTATLLLDRQKGVITVTNYLPNYVVSGSSFAINVNG